MKKNRLLLFVIFVVAAFVDCYSQPAMPAKHGIDDAHAAPGLMAGIPSERIQSSFEVTVNSMDEECKRKLNAAASNYRSASRGILSDLGKMAGVGAFGAVVEIVGSEIMNLTKIRSQQKKKWMEMRQKECTFVDSLQSVKGQSDFYARQSSYGPLDPSNMNFDGITLRSCRDGHEVLRMVCHIDTTRFDHLFLHSKFYLVLDSVVFHPYLSFLPNMKANKINNVDAAKLSKDEKDYWNTISHFNFTDQQNPSINVRMDISSSWINELVQVFQDVKLGSFSVNIPVSSDQLRDSVYVYSRAEALREGKPVIDIVGDCFVVPRSYMPVSSESPSWGTGEYKMKVVLTENCRYNPNEGRATNWHRDYKQLVRMQNHGKASNEYLGSVITTFRDNASAIMKATYTPILSQIPTLTGLSTMGGMSGAATGMPKGMSAGAATNMPAAMHPGNEH